MPAIEPVRGLTVPTVAGDVGIWGGELNTTINSLAAILGTQISLSSSTVGLNVTLTSSQAQSARVLVNNTSSQPFQLNMPASNFASGEYSIGYISSQLQALTVTAGSSGSGQTAQIAGSSSGINRQVYNDGVNVFFNDVQTFSALPLQAGLAFGFDGSSLAPATGTKPGIVMPFSITIASWEVVAWDVAGSMAVDFIANGVLASSHNTPTLTSSFIATGSASGWALNSYTSGTTLAPFVNSASSATKFSVTLFGNRTT